MTSRPGNPSRTTRDVYDILDINRENSIDQDELKIAMESLGFGFTPSEIQRLVIQLDPLNQGTIDFEAFGKLIHEKMSKSDLMDRILTSFKILDEDKTGRIKFKDLKRVSRDLGYNLSDMELHEMINEADIDNDGEISLEEFISMIQSVNLT